MESIVMSSKAVSDIKDPVLKGLVQDIATITQAEMLQAIASAKKPTAKSRKAVSPHFAEFEETYRNAAEPDKVRLGKMAKKINSASFRKNAEKLGLNLSLETPVLSQINYEKAFGHLKGKGEQLAKKLDMAGHQTVVPFTAFPDEETEQLINRIKKADPEADDYADYLNLLPKDKLLELYEREIGTAIQSRSAFLATHEPDATEITKIRRTVAEWQRRGGAGAGSSPTYRNRILKLIVTRVRCVDETEHEGVWPFEGEGIANDRIDLGAISIDPDQNTRRFGPQMVSDNFEDNREFPWRREVARFNLDAIARPYPRDFGVTMTIAEIDYGAGFANTLNEIWKHIRAIIVEVVTKIGEAIGAILGAGEVGKMIGKVVGELFALGLSEIVRIISATVEDDVFEPQSAIIRLNSQYSTFLGVDDKIGKTIRGPFRSPEQVFRYQGHGGSYLVYAVWELERVGEDGSVIDHTGQTLRITTQTGGDDLRGYNTAWFSINYSNGTTSREYLLHRGHGGGQRSEQTFALDAPVALSAIRSITVRHDGNPNWPDGYDNWNLDHLKIELIDTSNVAIHIHESSGAPLIRFTGSQRTFVAHKQ